MTEQTLSWSQLALETEGRLASSGIDNSSSEARWLVEEVSGLTAAEFGTELATQKRVAHLDSLVSRRCDGEPLQYVIGHWPFRQLDLMVDRRVLIPRPETELVVSVALEALDRAQTEAPLVADLGTGSGAIGFSIATERVGSQVWATDRSEEALAVARANLAGIGRAATRVNIAQGYWFEAIPPELGGKFDLIVSNPPYVANDAELPETVGKWEPREALFSGDDGLGDIRLLVTESKKWLANSGALVMEMGEEQVGVVSELLSESGYGSVQTFEDLTLRPRGVVAQL